MIRNEEDLKQTREALAELEKSLAALDQKKSDMHPDWFALMSEPILDHIHRLSTEISEFEERRLSSASPKS